MEINMTHSNSNHKHSQPIRNIQGFLKSYMTSESAQRALRRNPKLLDCSTVGLHNKKIDYKEFSGSNQLALALEASIK